jgi:hypothetical protein
VLYSLTLGSSNAPFRDAVRASVPPGLRRKNLLFIEKMLWALDVSAVLTEDVPVEAGSGRSRQE